MYQKVQDHGWIFHHMTGLSVMETVFKSLYTFEQTNSQVCFISTRLIVPPYYMGYAKHSNESWKVPECGQFYEQQVYFPTFFLLFVAEWNVLASAGGQVCC